MSSDLFGSGGTNSTEQDYTNPVTLNSSSDTLTNSSDGSLIFTPKASTTVTINGNLDNSGTVNYTPSSSGGGNSFYLGSSSSNSLSNDGKIIYNQADTTSGPTISFLYGNIINGTNGTIDVTSAGGGTVTASNVSSMTNLGTIKIVETSGSGMTSTWGNGSSSTLNNSGTFTIDNSGASSGSTINFNFGGGVTNSGALSLSYPAGSTSIWSLGTGGLNNSGTLSLTSADSSSGNIAINTTGTITNTGSIDAVGTTLTINKDISGDGNINLSNGATVTLFAQNGTALGQTFNFEGGENTLNISSLPGTFTGKIRGFSNEDSINVGISGTVTYDKDSGILTLTTTSGKTYKYDVGENYTGEFSDSDNGVITYSGLTSCYLPGTMILTPEGEVAVEKLEVGDLVLTHDITTGASVPMKIVWAGSSPVNVTGAAAGDEAGAPVRIFKNAFDNGIPAQDLLVTSEHCMLINGQFIPVRMLVNGRSVIYDRSFTQFPVYHIETEKHAILTANGALSESFLNTENYSGFRQAGKIVSLNIPRKITWADAAAPLNVTREFVEPVFHAISLRAEQHGFVLQTPESILTNDTNFHLVTETGAKIRQIRESDGRVMFMIPAGIERVRLVSNASRPCDVIGPFVDDRRNLGVLAGNVTLCEGNATITLTEHLQDPELSGWNNIEGETARWTKGNALLKLGQRPMGSIALMAIDIHAGGPYILEDRLPEQSSIQA